MMKHFDKVWFNNFMFYWFVFYDFTKKSLSFSKLQRFYSMFSSTNFIILAFLFKCMMHLKLFLGCEVGTKVYFFIHIGIQFQHDLGKGLFFPFQMLCAFIENKLTVCVCVCTYSNLSISFQPSICVNLHPHHDTILITTALMYILM